MLLHFTGEGCFSLKTKKLMCPEKKEQFWPTTMIEVLGTKLDPCTNSLRENNPREGALSKKISITHRNPVTARREGHSHFDEGVGVKHASRHLDLWTSVAKNFFSRPSSRGWESVWRRRSSSSCVVATILRVLFALDLKSDFKKV